MSTPRTHDDGRNDKQRQRDEDTRRGREPDDGRKGGDRRNLLEDKPHDFLERTKPEDRLDDTSHHGQQTRDNVNPAIPSAEPGKGDIVDPRSLGMEGQAGVKPPDLTTKVEQWPSLGLDHTKRGEDQVKEAENRQKQAKEGSGGLGELPRDHSINEPPGSNIYPGEGGPNQLPPGTELPPLVLTDIDPDSIIVGSAADFVLTVTGSGFGPNCVVMIDDEDMPTVLVNQTTLTATVPVAAAADIVDVEVARDEDLSDVLTFEFVAPAGRRSSEKAERKPKKAEPRGKRAKKDKSKSGKR